VFDVRLLVRDDAAAAGRLLVEAYPHRAHEPPAWQRSLPREQAQRWIAFRATPAEVAGYAALWRVDGRRFRFDVVVSPAHRRQGLGGQLIDLVNRQARIAGAETMQARAYAEASDALAFLARRGFTETMRMRGFLLDLAAADVATLLQGSGITFGSDLAIAEVTTSELADSGFWRRLTDLHDAAREGWPDPDPGGPIQPLEPDALRSMLIPLGDPPVAFFVATHGEHLVGYSLMTGGANGRAQFAATAVRPRYRDRRLATTLRARCLMAARAAGYATVGSASGSAALIRINQRFGFAERYCEVRLVRRLDGSRRGA
jgi:mycothiol synthase